MSSLTSIVALAEQWSLGSLVHADDEFEHHDAQRVDILLRAHILVAIWELEVEATVATVILVAELVSSLLYERVRLVPLADVA